MSVEPVSAFVGVLLVLCGLGLGFTVWLAWGRRGVQPKAKVAPEIEPHPFPFLDPLKHLATDEQEAELLAKDYRAVFRSQQGARVLGDLMHRCFVFEPYPMGSTREDRDRIDGMRELALSIVKAAGYKLEKMPRALMDNDLRQATEGTHHDRAEREPDPAGDPTVPILE